MVSIYPLLTSPFRVKSVDNAYTTNVLEFFLLDGRPAWVGYDREQGITSHGGNTVTVYDEATDLIIAASGSRRADGNDPTNLIALMRKFLAAVSPPPVETPPPPATPPDAPVPEPPAEPAAPGEPAPRSFRYDTYDLSGAVAEPGHYAFLADQADPADPASVVTTYEGLRDGTATALRIHTHDAHGVSQADLYGAVEVGDLVEWKQADDCFVRYTVTDVKPDPSAASTRWWLGVEWMTYAFTGCSGPIAGDTAATFEWGDLPDLGGTSLTAPIRHGSWQIVPENWSGATEAPEPYHELPGTGSLPLRTTESLAEAQTFLYWRTPTLPDGWTLDLATTSGEYVAYGYRAWFFGPEGRIIIDGGFFPNRGFAGEALWRVNDGWLYVVETRVIADRPARVRYSPLGPLHDSGGIMEVRIYDPATESGYALNALGAGWSGANIDSLIAIAASLFEPPNAP